MTCRFVWQQDGTWWSWLQSDLEANKAAKNNFVMLHHSVFGPPDPDTPQSDTGFSSLPDRDRLHALVVKYGVRAVFCGHNHAMPGSSRSSLPPEHKTWKWLWK